MTVIDTGSLWPLTTLPGGADQVAGNRQEYDKIDVKQVHKAAVARIEELMSTAPDTLAGDELDVLATLVDAYEAKHNVMDAPDPAAAVQFPMEQQQLSRTDLESLIGSRARVSEALAGKRPLTLEMVRRVKGGLGISANLLIMPHQPWLEVGPAAEFTCKGGGSGESSGQKGCRQRLRQM